jgi:hypothetical protein
VLKQWEVGGRNSDLLATALAGLVGEHWTLVFLQFYGVGSVGPLTPEQIIHGYSSHRPLVRQWLEAGQLNLVVASLDLLKRHLQRQVDYEAAVSTAENRRNLEQFFSELPGDLKRQLRLWLKDRGFGKLKVPKGMLL